MLRTILAIVGLVIGVVLILAAIFNWKIVPVPSSTPSIGSPAGPLSPAVRAMVAIVGAILVLLAILTFAGVL